jgi:hypothetical protein
MDVKEQTETLLVLTTKTQYYTYIAGIIAILLGLLLLLSNPNSQGNSIVYNVVVGPIGILGGLYILLGPNYSSLTIDKNLGEIIVRRRYIFGVLTLKRSIDIAGLTNFFVQHQTHVKLQSPTLKFIFKSSKHNATFSSNNLRYGGRRGFAIQLSQTDAHNSDEERLISVIESYINMQPTARERGIDSPNISKRLLIISTYLVGGFIVAIGLIWFYYHIIQAK